MNFNAAATALSRESRVLPDPYFSNSRLLSWNKPIYDPVRCLGSKPDSIFCSRLHESEIESQDAGYQLDFVDWGPFAPTLLNSFFYCWIEATANDRAREFVPRSKTSADPELVKYPSARKSLRSSHNGPEKPSDPGGKRHGKCAPERHSGRRPPDVSPARLGTNRTENCKKT